MNPGDIPIFTGPPVRPGDKPPTFQSSLLTAEVEKHIDNINANVYEFGRDYEAGAKVAHDAAFAASNKVIERQITDAIASGKRVDKKLGKVVSTLESDALAHLDRTVNLLRTGGANPSVTMEDIASQNALHLHSDAALETIIIPMIEHQKGIVPGTQQCDAEDPPPWCPTPRPPDRPGGDFPPGYPGGGNYPTGPGGYPQLPGEPPPKPLPGGEWPYPDDCMGTPEECHTPVPPVPPPPPPPPPYPDPCPKPEPACPAPVIVVNCAPCAPTPTPTPTVPPPYPPPPPKPPEPVPPVPPVPPTKPGDIPTVPPPPPPPPPTPPKPNFPNYGGFSWDRGDPCLVHADYVRTFPMPVPRPNKEPAPDDIRTYLSGMFDFFGSDVTSINSWVTTGINEIYQFGSNLFNGVIDGMSSGEPIDRGSLVTTGFMMAGSGWAAQLLRAPIDRLTMDAMYEFQSQTAFELPTQDEFDTIYLTGQINEEQWRCYTKALGHAPNTHQMALNAKINRPGITDIVSLRLRGAMSQQEYYDAQRRNGVVTSRDANAYLKLAEYIPGPSDLVRMMTRDVMNKTVVDDGGYDIDFVENYTGIIEQWGESQGVSRDVMLANWRAHWTMPSNTDIYEFIRRLRPGRVPAGLEFTEADAVDLLKVNDHAPGHINRLVAISYHPINRTDVESAYISGAMGAGEMYERYLDLGYSPRDAKQLQDASTIKKFNQVQQSAGIWTKRRISREYIGGGLSRFDAERLLGQVIPDNEQLKAVLDSADLMRETQAKNACVKGARRQYFTGFYTAQELKIVLLDLEMDRLQIDTLIKGWTCERANRAKEPTIKLLGQWAEYGIITPTEMLTRLVNLGYGIDDAKRIIVALNIELTIKATAKSKAESRQQASDRRIEMAERRRVERERKAKEKEDNQKPKK